VGARYKAWVCGCSLLRLWVRILQGAGMSVCCECCVLSHTGLCDGLITRREIFFRMWCVVVCDLETSRIGSPWPTGDLFCQTKRQTNLHMAKWHFTWISQYKILFNFYQPKFKFTSTFLFHSSLSPWVYFFFLPTLLGRIRNNIKKEENNIPFILFGNYVTVCSGSSN